MGLNLGHLPAKVILYHWPMVPFEWSCCLLLFLIQNGNLIQINSFSYHSLHPMCIFYSQDPMTTKIAFFLVVKWVPSFPFPKHTFRLASLSFLSWIVQFSIYWFWIEVNSRVAKEEGRGRRICYFANKLLPTYGDCGEPSPQHTYMHTEF